MPRSDQTPGLIELENVRLKPLAKDCRDILVVRLFLTFFQNHDPMLWSSCIDDLVFSRWREYILLNSTCIGRQSGKASNLSKTMH